MYNYNRTKRYTDISVFILYTVYINSDNRTNNNRNAILLCDIGSLAFRMQERQQFTRLSSRKANGWKKEHNNDKTKYTK